MSDTTTCIRLLAGYLEQTEKLSAKDAFQEAWKRWDESSGSSVDRLMQAMGDTVGEEWEPSSGCR